jgi:hypothetical protein
VRSLEKFLPLGAWQLHKVGIMKGENGLMRSLVDKQVRDRHNKVKWHQKIAELNPLTGIFVLYEMPAYQPASHTDESPNDMGQDTESENADDSDATPAATNLSDADVFMPPSPSKLTHMSSLTSSPPCKPPHGGDAFAHERVVGDGVAEEEGDGEGEGGIASAMASAQTGLGPVERFLGEEASWRKSSSFAFTAFSEVGLRNEVRV